MTLTKFELGALVELDDGRVRAAYEQAIDRCVADCKDRPGLADARSVSLSCSVVPVMDERGNLESCDLRFKVADALPKRTSRSYNMRAGPQGLFFNEMSPENVRQATLPMQPAPLEAKEKVDEETGEVSDVG